jgi:microcystin-dependent protein
MYAGTTTDVRTYSAADLARFFRAILTEGVVDGLLNEFAVLALGTGMTVNVATGQAWVYGRHVKSDAVESLAISAADPTKPRIDLVVLRNTFASGITLAVLKGTAASTPVAPTCTTTGGLIYEIPLAQVLIGAGVTVIAANKVTDVRGYMGLKYVRQTSLVHPAALDLGSQKITGLADGIATTDALTKRQMDASASFSPAPIGVVRAFGTTTIPAGFLLCNGAAVSRTTYATLFAAIGTTFGAGNGSTTFNLPNMIDRFVVALNTADSDFSTLGKTGGAATVALAIGNLPAHVHTLAFQYLYEYSNENNGSENATGQFGANGSTGPAGSGTAHNNLPPWIKLAYGVRC